MSGIPAIRRSIYNQNHCAFRGRRIEIAHHRSLLVERSELGMAIIGVIEAAVIYGLGLVFGAVQLIAIERVTRSQYAVSRHRLFCHCERVPPFIPQHKIRTTVHFCVLSRHCAVLKQSKVVTKL